MHDTNDDDQPPFGLTRVLAWLEKSWAACAWGDAEMSWLDENVPLFDTGIYAFDANRWYNLAAALCNANIRQDLWILCCCDMDFSWPNGLYIPSKLNHVPDVLAMTSSWCYSHASQLVCPSWEAKTQTLYAFPRTGPFTKEHTMPLLAAFSTPCLMEQVRKGVLVQQAFGLDHANDVLKDGNDARRWLAKVLHPNFLAPALPENVPLPDLGI